MDLRTKLYFWNTSLIIPVVLNTKNSDFCKCSLQSGCAFIKCSELNLSVLFSNFCSSKFLLYWYHRGVEDHFIRNVIMLLSEGLAGTKINCTEVIVCGRKCFISFRDVLQSCNDSKEIGHLMLVICIKTPQV